MDAITSPRQVHLGDCAWFWVWAAIGGPVALSFNSGVAIFLLPIAAVLLFAAVRRQRRRDSPSPLGLVPGAGVPFLVVAYLQCKGPGTVCWGNATFGGCDSYLDPRPWLVIGVTLVFAGIAGLIYKRHPPVSHP